MKRTVFLLLCNVFALLVLASPAAAAFGFKEAAVTFSKEDGSAATEAGSHPYSMTTRVGFNADSEGVAEGEIKDLVADLPPGLVGNATAVPRCSNVDFFVFTKEEGSACSDDSAVGIIGISQKGEPTSGDFGAVYNLVPTTGSVAKLGFHILVGVAVTVDIHVRPEPPYNLYATVSNVAQAEPVTGSELIIWGNPAHPSHDAQRGNCVPFGGVCETDIEEKAFITLPRSCAGPLVSKFRARSWQEPETVVATQAVTPGMTGCEELGFAAGVSTSPTTPAAESPSGLEYDLDIEDKGLIDPDEPAQSDVRNAKVTLPAGMTLNPSVAAGLTACTVADLGRETADSQPGDGCPLASKIGSVEVETPLLEGEILHGSVFVASQFENLQRSRFAIYMVIKDPELGVLVKLAGRVEPNEAPGPNAGQIVTTFEEAPQFPFSHLRFRFRGGGRGPLVTPPSCGTHTTDSLFFPWADPSSPVPVGSAFSLSQGIGGGPCFIGTPFAPSFQAGTVDNAAGSFSPLSMRLTRNDGHQSLTRFSADLPPGLVASLAGVSRCPQAAIEAAKVKTGRVELAVPSCPIGSRVGRLLGGAGVGSELTFVPGSLYLAGPFAGAPLSMVAIVPAVTGPFDIGTIVTQVALRVDPRTAEVKADGSSADPIPHMLAGIPLRVRDVHISVDRPNFTLNPTSCDPSAIRGSLWGSGGNAFSSADDTPVSLASRFQAANCANLNFKPRLSLRLRGGTKRGDYPRLRGVFRPRPGDANLSRLVLRLPHSAFLAQEHIRTICTRVQFAAKTCPKGSIYGRAVAYTPLLDRPLEGPVYLRSSDNPLPDMVASLRGLIDIEAVGSVDSVKGGIRTKFELVPDAPLSKFVINMRGGKKGLIVNSKNLCTARSRANARFTGHNGKTHDAKPVVKAQCGKKKKSGSRRR